MASSKSKSSSSSSNVSSSSAETPSQALARVRAEMIALEQQVAESVARETAMKQEKFTLLAQEFGVTLNELGDMLSRFIKTGSITGIDKVKNRVVLTDAQREDIIGSLRRNPSMANVRELAERFGCSEPTIQNIKKEAGLTKKRVNPVVAETVAS